MTPAFQHAADLVSEGDKDRFLATLFAPAEARPGLLALYAYHLELARVRDTVREPLPGEIRLQWWRDALNGTAAGEATGNPIADALLETISCYNLPVEPLVAMSEAWIFDLYDDPMPSLNDLEGYAGETRGALVQLAAIVLADGADPNSAAAAGHAGAAQTIAAVLASLPLHAARNQLYLPADVLKRHAVDAADVLARRDTPALRSAIGEMREHASHHLEKMEQLLLEAAPAARVAFLPAFLATRTLRATQSRRYRPFETDILPAQWLRQLDLWRAARRLRRSRDKRQG